MLTFLIQLVEKLFGSTYKTGLLLDHPSDLAALPKHELFFGGGEPVDWSIYCPPFRYQGSTYWCTAFTGTSIASIFEKKEKGESLLFSPMELFYRSGGTLTGNYLIAVAQAMKNTVVLESYVPTPVPTLWNSAELEKYRALAQAPQKALDLGKQYAVKSAASVVPTHASLMQALSVSPLSIAIGIGRGYFNDPAPRQTSYSAYHNVVLTSIDQDGNYVIFDSLTQRRDFNGFHKLAPDYEILSALSFVDLPDNWQGIQQAKSEDVHAGALNHYGKVRSLVSEQSAANQLTEASRKNPTLSAYIGREFLVAVNAVAYGDYTIQDLLNHYTNIRRTGKRIFDLNYLRHSQPAN